MKGRKGRVVNVPRDGSIVFGRVDDVRGMRSCRVSQEIANMLGRDDNLSRRGGRYLDAAFEYFASIRFRGTLTREMVRELAIADAKRNETLPNHLRLTQFRESELSAWIDGIAR